MNRSLRGYKPRILGPYALANVPSVPPSETILLEDGGWYVYRDSNTGHLAPAFVRDYGLTLKTCIDQATYVAGSPPTGWTESPGAGGSITVAGSPQYITIASATGTSSNLAYNIGSVTAGDIIVVVLRGYAASIAGSVANYSMARIRFDGETIQTRYDHGATTEMTMVSSTGGTSPDQPAMTSVATAIGVYRDPDVYAASETYVLDDTRGLSTDDNWAASSGSQVELFTVSSGGGAGTGYLYIDHCCIYVGAPS